MTRLTSASVVAVAVFVALVLVVASRTSNETAPCGAGFVRSGSRCCSGPSNRVGACSPVATSACPAPLVPTVHGCDEAERDVVHVPATTVIVGPSDWEAEGRVGARTVRVRPFALDRLEVSAGRFCAPPAGGSEMNVPSSTCDASDPARAASGVTLDQARAFCRGRGGRLPTDDEWLAAAGGDRPRRYPWGDTGAVCRRAAWGLESGPCASGGSGPDTVGAHSEGATPLGIHDLAGNVAEWVESSCSAGEKCAPIVRGGSYATRLATELRTWLRREVSSEVERSGDRSIGFRCAYDE